MYVYTYMYNVANLEKYKRSQPDEMLNAPNLKKDQMLPIGTI